MATLAELNGWPEARARAELLRCCGCASWAAAMAGRRPFESRDALLRAADEEWGLTARPQWIEAFSHHPRIGGKDALRAKFAATRDWARGEQAGAAAADERTLDALERGNRDYEERFGHVFVVCAAGKTAPEMLALLRARLGNDAEDEARLAAAEQAKITRIRLEKLIP